MPQVNFPVFLYIYLLFLYILCKPALTCGIRLTQIFCGSEKIKKHNFQGKTKPLWLV